MISGNDYLKVLICSANVGNAEPTPTSFGAWIPDDGEINGPITNTLYPLGHMERTLAVGPYGAAATASSSANNNDNYNNNNNNSNNKISSSHEDEIIQSLLFTSSDNNNNNDNTTTNGKKDKFDIIVLGMQEAAFVNKQKKECGGGGDNNNGTTTTTITTTTTSSIRSSSAASSSEMERVHNNNNNSNDNDDDDNNNNGGGVNHDNNNDNKSSSSPPTKKKGFNPLRKGAKKAAKAGMVMRGISANQTYNGLSSNSSGGGGGGGGVITSNVLGYDNNKLADLIQTRCPSYEIITSSLRGEMRLFVLVQSHLTQDISNVYIAAENTGIGSIMANKGGIIVTLTFRNMTRFSFMTCHLEAHEGMQHYIQRNKNLAEILGGAKTDPVYAMQDATIFSHHMFVCGDLNYRIKFSEYEKMKEKKKKFMTNLMMKKMSMKGTSSSSGGGGGDDDGGGGLSSLSKGASCDEAEEEEEEESNNHKGDGGGGGEGEKKDEPANGSHFDQAKALVEAEDWKALNEGDELAGALKQKECLVGFSTLPCHWPPTFKVARGEGYQYNEKRTPSYTDRILWKSAEGMVNNVIPFLYEPCPEFITSDHKPIRGGFAVKLNKDQPSCTEKTSDSAPIERRGSGVFVRTIPNLKTAAHHDEERQIQILVSDLKCTNLPIMDNEFVGGLSDPYVLFVSSPKELLFSKAWPSSSIIPKNLNPVWKEDMYLTMDRKGMRNGQLAEGSMLMLTVMDYDATSGDDVIGSVALNLNELCSKLDLSAGGPPGKVQETYISRPILRNGQEYGMLECKLKTAFLAPKEVKSFLSGAKNVRTAMKTSWKSKIQAFTGFAAMS